MVVKRRRNNSPIISDCHGATPAWPEQHSDVILLLGDNNGTNALRDIFLKSLLYGLRYAANTRTKVGQVPHSLISEEYKPVEEFQFDRLHDYILSPTTDCR